MIPQDELPRWAKNVSGFEWVQEVIAQSFDNAAELLPKDSIIFGGAVRDAISALPLLGDMDVMVTPYSFRELCTKLRNSPKWRMDQRQNVGNGYFGPKKGGEILRNFTNCTNGRKVQVIASKSQTVMELLKELRESVDISCCGIVMRYDGSIITAVDNAIDCCKNRVLEFNNEASVLNIDKLRSRVIKLEKRGWKNHINLKTIEKEFKKKRKKS